MPIIVNMDFDKNNKGIHEQGTVKESLIRESVLSQIIGKSKVIQSLHRKIELSSSCDANVFITGESGTGKELTARAIHYLSTRCDKPFIPINCGAIPETLFENEFFGHVKGAFTHATQQQKGCVREAEGGTLFLDEIGTISPYIQVKLLRLLENKEYKTLGDSRVHKANVRIIAATNRDLPSLIREGAFREDLFYRLNIVLLHIPPLRERREDIPDLLDYFIDKYCKEYGRQPQTFSQALEEFLLSYDWPGNIRELENKIQQIIVMGTPDEVMADDIQSSSTNLFGHNSVTSMKTAKKEAASAIEKDYLAKLLSEHKGNVAAAAKHIGKNRTGLWNLLKKNELSPKQFRTGSY